MRYCNEGTIVGTNLSFGRSYRYSTIYDFQTLMIHSYTLGVF